MERNSVPLMTQICEDIGSGFEDEMIDMQARIGSYRSLQRRLTSTDNKKAFCDAKDDLLFGDLFPSGDSYISKSHSTRESLGGMSKEVFSEEDLHENLYRSVGSSSSGIPIGDNFNDGEIQKILKKE